MLVTSEVRGREDRQTINHTQKYARERERVDVRKNILLNDFLRMSEFAECPPEADEAAQRKSAKKREKKRRR